MSLHRRALSACAVSAAALLALAACGGDPGGTAAAAGATGTGASSVKDPLTLYNAQHESLTQDLVQGFTAKTGIPVKMRSGEDFEMANQIVQEGDRSPADVFITENSPAMVLLSSKGDFATLEQSTLAQVPQSDQASDGSWVGYAGRSTVLAYNTSVPKSALPGSILDLAVPRWKGQVGFSPTGADFQAIVSAVLDTQGPAKTQAWLKGLKANGQVYDGNTAVMEAVNRGEVKVGVIYHYYWFRDQNESGANSDHVRLKYFGHRDPGAFFSISGAGVLKSSKHQAEAQELVHYLTSPAGQKILADSDAMEYAINPKVKSNPALKPISQLDPPKIDPSTLNGPKVIDLMQQAGLL